MATCSYSFNDAHGNRVTLHGIPALKTALYQGELSHLLPEMKLLDIAAKKDLAKNNIRYSKSSILPENANPKGMNKQVVQRLVDNFKRGLNGIKNVEFKIYLNQQEAFGADYVSTENTKGFYTYQNGKNIIGVFADSLDSVQDTIETLRHETLAHFGLNLFTPEEKETFLRDVILAGKNDEVNALFEQVRKDYPEIADDELKQAEEVFAKIAEEKPQAGKLKALWQRILNWMMPKLRKIGLFKGSVSMNELQGMVQAIAENIRNNKAQQNFPKDAQSQFRVTDNIKDFFTGKPASVQTLSDISDMLQSGKPKAEKVDLQYYKDKLVTNITDLTRPFDRWVSDTFTPEQAAKLIEGKDRAQNVKQAYEKQVINKFGRPISDAVRAITKAVKGMKFQTAKDLAGFWMSATYAPEANTGLMAKDQKAIDDFEQEKFDAITKFNAIANPSQSTQDKLDQELNRLDREIIKAQDKQAKRIAAINRQEFIDLPKIKQDLIELRKDRSTHAAEITRLEKILEENVGLAGGLNNYTAATLIKQIEAKIPRDLLKNTAAPVYNMLKWKLEQDIKNGKVSQASVDGWNNSPHYVPLTGDPRTDDSVEDTFTVGSINQAKDHALKGRTGSIAQNAIDAAFEQVEKSARYHGWNDFKDALHSLYIDEFQKRVATGLSDKQAASELWDELGLKRRPADAQIPAGDNDIVYRKDNKGYIYTINNQAAMEALRQMNDESIPTILKPFQIATKTQALLVTVGMAGFAPPNMIRDTLEKSENIRTRTIAGVDMNKVGNDTLAYGVQLLTRLKMISSVLAEDTPLGNKFLPIDNTDPDVIKLKEYLSLGGSSTYGEMLSKDSKQLAEKLSKLGTAFDKGWDTLLLYNSAFETISGFAVYKALLDQGVSPKKAATESLNLMNFRKRGRLTSPLRALYMFVNPTAQGAHQLAKSLSTTRGRLRMAAYTTAAAFLYTILRSADGDDDELGFNRMDEQGNFALYRNIHIPTGDGEYIKIPIGFGMQQLAWAHGVNAVRTALGKMTLKEALGESALLWTKAVTPVAPAETSIAKNPLVWMAQTLSPQIIKPLTNIALDVTPFGSPLTNARYEKTDTAKSLQGRKQTPQAYKDLAQVLAQHGIDMYPEQLKAFVNGYAIGHLGDIVKVLIDNPTAESFGKHIVSPSMDRWLVANNDEKIKERLYYRLRDRMNKAGVKRSTGAELEPEELKLADMGDKLKKLEARARGKNAAATRAEKQGQMARAENLHKQAEVEKGRYMKVGLDFFLDKTQNLTF